MKADDPIELVIKLLEDDPDGWSVDGSALGYDIFYPPGDKRKNTCIGILSDLYHCHIHYPHRHFAEGKQKKRMRLAISKIRQDKAQAEATETSNLLEEAIKAST